MHSATNIKVINAEATVNHEILAGNNLYNKIQYSAVSMSFTSFHRPHQNCSLSPHLPVRKSGLFCVVQCLCIYHCYL